MVILRQPLYPVATGGIQLAALLQPAHIQHPFRDAGEADFSLKEVIIPKGNFKDYHGFRFRLDDERSKYDCSVRHVYGVDDSFFGDAVRIVS